MKKKDHMSKIQQIIRTANQEGIGRANALTFVYLWAEGENEIDITLDDLSAGTCVERRTMRHHLYTLEDAGWIEYRPSFSHGNIKLNRFKHS